jgi:(p)ppGpp synthase/HD superfamily hydrolase
MADSLRRIRVQPHDVWAVKLADRITNLAPPPAFWTAAKIAGYRAEAIMIADALGEAKAVEQALRRGVRAAAQPDPLEEIETYGA